MLIGYADETLRMVCEDGRVALERLSREAAELLPRRLSQLVAFARLSEVPEDCLLHRHRPEDDGWVGHHAILIDSRFRVVFRPTGSFDSLADGTPDPKTVTSIEIVAVGDH